MKKMSRLLIAVIFLALILFFTGSAFAENGISQRIEALRSKFPEGKYWNHQRQVDGDDGDSLLYSNNNSYADCVTSTPCLTHNGYANIGQYDCNNFDSALQCWGFANKVFYDIFGQFCSQLGGARSDIQNISIGDNIRLYSWDRSGHSAVVIGRNGNSLTIVEAGYETNCRIHWDRTININEVIGFFHATNWDQIYNDYGAYIDINGCLDGINYSSLEASGTVDVYVNGECVADNVNDYYIKWPAGAAYSITDIRPAGGWYFDGLSSGTLEGTVGASSTDIRLKFSSLATLDVNALLDQIPAKDTEDYGFFDVYINGVPDALQVTEYREQWPQGTTYEICNINAEDGKYYNRAASGNISGTLNKGVTTVTLAFSTVVPTGTEWRVEDTLPDYIDPATVEIEYKNYYQKTAQTSPGSGWMQVPGSAVTTYVNDGAVYDWYVPLQESETCVYVGSYYYHYCGSSMGSRVNFEQNWQYTDYHVAGDCSMFDILGEWPDDDVPEFRAYKLRWNCGQWAGNAAICATGMSDIWYRRYQYQNRVAVTNYTWTKESGWSASADPDAFSTKVRFRLKRYQLQFNANGGMNAPSKQIKYHGVDLLLPVHIPVKNGFSFAGWNTQANGSGTFYDADSLYTENADQVLYAQWETPTKVILPADTKIIGEYAFENIHTVIVEVPEGCTTIEAGAFRNCRKLTEIHLPASLTTIAPDAFEGCSRLTIYAPEDSEAIRFAVNNGIPYEIPWDDSFGDDDFDTPWH